MWSAYLNLDASENKKYRVWFEAEQAKELPKLLATMIMNGVERMVYVRFSDYTPHHGWDSPTWNWQGIVRYEGTLSEPVLVRKPSYYTYNMLMDRISDFVSSESLDFGEDVFAYLFTFNDRAPLFLAWTEGENSTIDLSEHIISDSVRVSHIVTQLDSGSRPIYPADTLHATASVPVSGMPVFVEQI